jgi:hypothetical protein
MLWEGDHLLLAVLVVALVGLQTWTAAVLARLVKLQTAIVRPLVRAEQRRILCQLLLDSGRFLHPAARDRLLQDMPPGFAGSVTRDATPDVDLANIVSEAARWSSAAWRQLLANARFLLPPSSDSGRELARLCEDWDL